MRPVPLSVVVPFKTYIIEYPKIPTESKAAHSSEAERLLLFS
jgi:hypothetical protein